MSVLYLKIPRSFPEGLFCSLLVRKAARLGSLGFVLDLDLFSCLPNQCILQALLTDALEPWLALYIHTVKTLPGATHHTVVTPATWVSLYS